jgi:type II secretory pathway component PulF
LSLKTPFIKDFINSYYEYITTDMLALSVSSGISIVSSIEMVLKDINNLVYKEKMKKVLTKIKEGETLTNSFKSEKLFSPFIIRMIKVGEESGRLENQLEFVSKKSQEKLDELSARLPKIIEPIIMFVVAGFLILMVTALMGPMYDMISKLN